MLCNEPKVIPEKPSATKAACRIDPLKDPRWNGFLQTHPRATVFHSTPWLEALRRTYGYEPCAYAVLDSIGNLESCIVFCRVESWLTKCRLVSLPFSDHCEPLVQGTENLQVLIDALEEELAKEYGWYIEIRHPESDEIGTTLSRSTMTYMHHQIDLGPDLDTIFRGLHQSSTQRKIRRAEREGLTYQEGSTESLLDRFYRLLVITRQRHQVPPQPISWFRNLMDCFGETLKIRIASKDGRPVAGMLTLRYKDTLVYKYGGSDVRFNNLGGMHLLYWNAIREAKSSGLRLFDLGRTDTDQAGLSTFKSRWGATQSTLTYSRFATSDNPTHIFDRTRTISKMRIVKYLFLRTPTRLLPVLGRVLYKHIG